jgi:hypothetical protein
VAPRHAHPAPPSNHATGSQESFCREGGTGLRVAPVPPRKSGAFDPSSASWPREGVGTKGVPYPRAPRGFNALAGGVEQRAGRRKEGIASLQCCKQYDIASMFRLGTERAALRRWRPVLSSARASTVSTRGRLAVSRPVPNRSRVWFRR